MKPAPEIAAGSKMCSPPSRTSQRLFSAHEDDWALAAVRSPGAQEGTARENARGASQAVTTLIRPAFRERGFRRITISMSWSSAVNRFIRRSTENPASL